MAGKNTLIKEKENKKTNKQKTPNKTKKKTSLELIILL